MVKFVLFMLCMKKKRVPKCLAKWMYDQFFMYEVTVMTYDFKTSYMIIDILQDDELACNCEISVMMGVFIRGKNIYHMKNIEIIKRKIRTAIWQHANRHDEFEMLYVMLTDKFLIEAAERFVPEMRDVTHEPDYF